MPLRGKPQARSYRMTYRPRTLSVAPMMDWTEEAVSS